MAIVDLDREPRDRRLRRRDAGLIAALLGSASLFAVAMWTGRPVETAPAAGATESLTAQSVERSLFDRNPSAGVAVLPPYSITAPVVLTFPRALPDVQLGAIPDRLANEAPPANLTNVVFVRGRAAIATVTAAEGPAMVSWTEAGVAYWLVSPKYTISELIKIADELRMPTDLDMRRPNLDWRRK